MSVRGAGLAAGQARRARCPAAPGHAAPVAGVQREQGQVEFPALLALYENDGRTQRELCDIASVDQSTMAKTLTRMRRDGLLREEPDPGDGRRTRYHLTPHARSLEPALAAAGHDIITQATRGIPAARLAAFNQTLTDMTRNLTADPLS